MNRVPGIARLLLAGLLAGVPVLATAATERGTTGPVVMASPVFGVDDLLLLEVDVDKDMITDALGAYSSRAGVFLPLGEICRLLELPIVVNPPERSADGWYLSESRKFILDLDQGLAETDGRKVSFGPADAVLFQDEIYVRSDLMQKLLPLALEVNRSELILSIKPREHLPFQDRQLRGQRRSALGATGEQQPPMRVQLPYELLTPPAADLNVALEASNASPTHTSHWELRFAGDVAFTNLQAYVASDNVGTPDSARFMFERTYFPGRGGDAPDAIQVGAGDVFTPALTLGLGSHGGRGFAVTTGPLEQASVFDQLDLRGELPPGYEVELYVGEVLRASQAVPVQGRYEFLDVPLLFGLNVVRLAFYGPHGERYEEVRRINVGGGQLAAGQTTASIAVVEQGVPLVELHSPAVDPALFDPGYGKLQYSASVARGLTSSVTARLGVGRYTPFMDGPRDLFNVGVAAAIRGLAVQVDYSGDSDGGQAAALGLAGRAGPLPILLRHVEYQGSYANELDTGAIDLLNPMTRSTDLRTDFLASLPGSGRTLPISLTARREERDNGATRWAGGGRVTASAGRLLMSSSVDYERYSPPGERSSERMTGSFDASTILGGQWQLRCGLSYELLPQFDPVSTSIAIDHNLSARTALHLGVQQDWTPTGISSIQGAMTWRLGLMDVSLTANYATKIDLWTAGLQFSVGSLFDPLRHSYRTARPGAAAGAALALDAFIDEDGNGIHGPGDRPLPGLSADSGDGPAVADQHGELLVTGLGATGTASVNLNVESIGDPYLVPPATVIEFSPRPGRAAVATYALHRSGEASVRFMLGLPGGTQRGLSALNAELVDTSGRVAAHGRTEYDGSVLFEGLSPGRYGVRLEPAQATRLKLSLAEELSVVVPASGGYAGVIDAHVEISR